MPRVQFSDVTPPERRSIRNIPIPKSGNRKIPITINKPEKISPPQIYDAPEKTEVNAPKYYGGAVGPAPVGRTGGRQTKKKYVFGGIAVLAVLIFIIGMMTVFASATINITPKSQEIEVDMKIVGTNEMGKDGVKYEIIKLSKSKVVSIPATGEEAAELKASGKIVIYNNFSTEPQRLIIRTRFESPEGLIFRIPESVVVPGKTTKNGVEAPGSIEVTVFADEAGDKYNIKKTDFTIPGFKTDATRYKNIYARSSTETSGGFVGKMKTVLPADKQLAMQSIDLEMQADLKKELETKIPEGLTLLSGSIIYKSKELPPKEEGSSVTMGEEVTAYAVMLNTQDLSGKITAEYVPKLAGWNNIKPTINNFSALNVAGMPTDLESNTNLNLQISGKIKVLADIDTNLISQRLLGAPKGDGAKIMDEFAGISSITAAIRPVWKMSFPENPSKIYVQTVTND